MPMDGPPPMGGPPPQGPGQAQPGVIVKPVRGVPVKPVPPEDKKPVEQKEAQTPKSDVSSCGDATEEEAKNKKADEEAKKKADEEKKAAQEKEAIKAKLKAQVVAQQQAQVQAVQVQIQIGGPGAGPGGVIVGPGGQIMPGVQFPFDTTTRVILKEGKPKKEPTCYSGSMRIKAVKDVAAVFGAADPKQHLLGLKVSAEPKMQIAALTDVKILKVVDDQDQRLRAIAESYDDGMNGGFGGPWGGAMPIRAKRGIIIGGPMAPPMIGDGGNHLLPVKLIKGAKESTTLKELSGTITAQVLMSPEQMMEATDIRKASGKTFQGKDGGYIKILGVTENNGQLTLRVEYETPKDVFPVNGMNGQFNNPWGGGFGGGIPVPQGAPPVEQDVKEKEKGQAKKVSVTDAAVYGLTLVDDKGNALPTNQVSVGGRWQPNGTVINEYNLTWTLGKDVAASKLVFSGQRNATVDIPFSFKNVDLK